MTVYHTHGPLLRAETRLSKKTIAWLKGATEFAALIIFICGTGCFVGLVTYGIFGML